MNTIKITAPKLEIGQIFRHESGIFYILAIVGYDKHQLIGLDNGVYYCCPSDTLEEAFGDCIDSFERVTGEITITTGV